MRRPKGRAPPDVGGVPGSPATSSAALRENQVQFMKRRYARAIVRGDDAHAMIIRELLDRLLNPRPGR
jgi:hypothetical protein